MKKSLLALAAVATLAISVASPAHAENGWVPGVAAGIIGGAINPQYHFRFGSGCYV